MTLHREEEHPIVERTLELLGADLEQVDGETVVHELFVLDEDAARIIREELLAIEDAAEVDDAVLSLICLGRSVSEDDGWVDNGKKIEALAQVHRAPYDFWLERLSAVEEADREQAVLRARSFATNSAPLRAPGVGQSAKGASLIAIRCGR